MLVQQCSLPDTRLSCCSRPDHTPRMRAANSADKTKPAPPGRLPSVARTFAKPGKAKPRGFAPSYTPVLSRHRLYGFGLWKGVCPVGRWLRWLPLGQNTTHHSFPVHRFSGGRATAGHGKTSCLLQHSRRGCRKDSFCSWP